MEKNYKKIRTSKDNNQKIMISKYENTITELEKKEIILNMKKKGKS